MISVVIPVKNGGDDLARCLAGIAVQTIDEPVEIVVVDSGSADGSADRARDAGAVVHEISASGVRAWADPQPRRRARDGTARRLHLAGRRRGRRRVARATLVAARRSPDVAGAYGRQLPHPDATAPERFFLDFMYGPTPRMQRLAAETDLTFETTFFSNVNAAIRRPCSSGSRSVTT